MVVIFDHQQEVVVILDHQQEQGVVSIDCKDIFCKAS